MWGPFRKTARILGVEVPRRRFTGWAAAYFVAFFCVPLLAICLAVDTLLYIILKALFGICFGLWCLGG